MDLREPRYWPFYVLPPEERSEYAQRQIDFLETAYQAGYKPYMSGSEDFGATAGERGGILLYRGCRGKHWEVLLGTVEETMLEAHADDYQCAAEAVLQWLRGRGSIEILEHLRCHLFVSPGCHFHASAERRRGDLACRSAWGKRWEILLQTKESPALTALIDDFAVAFDVLLRWLQGAEASEILASIQCHLVKTSELPEGYVLHESEQTEKCEQVPTHHSH